MDLSSSTTHAYSLILPLSCSTVCAYDSHPSNVELRVVLIVQCDVICESCLIHVFPGSRSVACMSLSVSSLSDNAVALSSSALAVAFCAESVACRVCLWTGVSVALAVAFCAESVACRVCFWIGVSVSLAAAIHA